MKFRFLSILGATTLIAACTTNASGDLAANGKIERLYVYDSESEEHTSPYTAGHVGHDWTPEDKQYRWIHVMGTPDSSSWTRPIQTVARVPDNIPMLHYGDIVEVYFKGFDISDYGKFDTSVLVKMDCPQHMDGLRACLNALKKMEGRSYLLGPVDGPAPDLNQFTFSKFYDEEGKPLSGKSLPQ